MRTYIVPVDSSKSSRIALDYAIARARRRKAKLVLVHVISTNAVVAASAEGAISAELIVKAQQAAVDSARDAMRKLVARLGLKPREYRLVFVESLDPAGTIAAQARKSRARMIIMGSEGRIGVRRIFSGSVAEATLRATRRPLLIVKQRRRNKAPAKLIVVPIDFSKVSAAVLRSAAQIAKTERETLLLLNVITEPDRMVPFYLRQEYHRDLLKAEHERLKRLAQHVDVPPRRYRVLVVRDTDAAAAIVKEAKKRRASMIVMGSHGRSGWKHLVLGSVAERTLRQAACPVLIYQK